MYCLKCNYALDGLASRRCPECGRAFDPRYPQTYSDGLPRHVFRRVGIRLAIIFFIGWLLFAFFINPSGKSTTLICPRCAAVEEDSEWWVPGTKVVVFSWRSAERSPTHDALAAHSIRSGCGHQWASCGFNEWGWRGCRLFRRSVYDFRDAASDPTIAAFFKHLAEADSAATVEAWIDYAFTEISDDVERFYSDKSTYRVIDTKLLGLLVEAGFPQNGFSSASAFKPWWEMQKDLLTQLREHNLALFRQVATPK